MVAEAGGTKNAGRRCKTEAPVSDDEEEDDEEKKKPSAGANRAAATATTKTTRIGKAPAGEGEPIGCMVVRLVVGLVVRLVLSAGFPMPLMGGCGSAGTAPHKKKDSFWMIRVMDVYNGS